jgi:hypothetical protein
MGLVLYELATKKSWHGMTQQIQRQPMHHLSDMLHNRQKALAPFSLSATRYSNEFQAFIPGLLVLEPTARTAIQAVCSNPTVMQHRNPRARPYIGATGAQVQAREKEHNERAEELTKARDETQAVRSDLAFQCGLNRQLTAQKARAENEVREWKGKHAESEQMVARQKEEIVLLKSQLAAASALRLSTQSVFTQAIERLEKKLEGGTPAAQEVARVHAEGLEWKARYEESKARCQELKARCEKSEQKSDQWQAKYEGCQATIQKMSLEIGELRGKISAYRKRGPHGDSSASASFFNVYYTHFNNTLIVPMLFTFLWSKRVSNLA